MGVFMKLVRVLVLGLVCFFGGRGFAAGGGEPCKHILAACEAAGFAKKHHKEKKGLFKDCLQPILAGSSVAGVTVSPDDVKACNDRKARHHRG
jgi:hypothetical protein